MNVLPAPRRSCCKVARLPTEIRAWINQSLADGVKYSEIAAGLKTKGFQDINQRRVAYWYKTGHKEWLHDQKRIEELYIRAQAALKMVCNGKGVNKETFDLSSQLLLCSQMNDVLQDFDPKRLKQLVDEKPEHYFRLASAINDQASESLRRKKLQLETEKYRDKVAEQERKIQEALSQTQAQGLTPEALAQIEQAARLL